MTESPELERVRGRVRFDILPDGTVEGDDGSAGIFAAALRYVCRMGAQTGALLEVGQLERVSTISSVSVLARVAGVSSGLRIAAEVDVDLTPLTRRRAAYPFAGVDVQDAITRCLKRVTVDLACDWTAIITDDSRVVGAVHDGMISQSAPAALPEVGLRALAVLASLDEPRRETGVRFDFARGSVLVAAVGEHALFAYADRFEATEVTRTVDAVRDLLVGLELRHASRATGSTRA